MIWLRLKLLQGKGLVLTRVPELQTYGKNMGIFNSNLINFELKSTFQR